MFPRTISAELPKPWGQPGFGRNRFGLGSTSAVMLMGVTIIVLLLILTAGMAVLNSTPRPQGDALVIFCAAGVSKPVEEAARAYAKELGMPVTVTPGGSGTLLTQLQIKKHQGGDLYLAADTSYTNIAREKGLVAETLPLAKMSPVIAVAKGNPKGVAGLDDLLREDVSVALGSPEAASIGKHTQKILEKAGLWKKVQDKTKVFHATVNETADAVVLQAVDAAIVWDATVRQRQDKLEMVRVDQLDQATKNVTIAVLTATEQPTEALRFARYLQAPEKGKPLFEKHGFQTIAGDAWEYKPQLTLFSGTVNSPAIKQSLEDFAEREGVEIRTSYEGCGILVSQMKASKQAGDFSKLPDAYFACDTSFMRQVENDFQNPVILSETDILIAVQEGNPHQITSLDDLLQEGLKIGMGTPGKSALGTLTEELLKEIAAPADAPSQVSNFYEALQPNIAVTNPKADLLVLQAVGGDLDAIIVYRANATPRLKDLDLIPIDLPKAKAAQPIGVGEWSRHKFLTARLIDHLTSANSRERFEKVGFRWRDAQPLDQTKDQDPASTEETPSEETASEGTQEGTQEEGTQEEGTLKDPSPESEPSQPEPPQQAVLSPRRCARACFLETRICRRGTEASLDRTAVIEVTAS